jgi:SAM-dependent methyltransferase
MDEHEWRTRGSSFGSVARDYARYRPDYPDEVVAWLVGDTPATVLELGAGTGKLTRSLVDVGHEVIATDPDPRMLARLRERVPGAHAAIAPAEAIPARSRSVDVVVCAGAFHWFDHDRALPEIARVLRPGGHLAVMWNRRDEGIPWVRKLGRLIGAPDPSGRVRPLMETEHFGWVEERRFRCWQALDAHGLDDLVRSRAQVAVMPEERRRQLLERVRALYDDYGRGPDGMLLPYVTECYRAEVRHQGPVRRPPAPPAAGPGPTPPPQDDPPDDPGMLLIDFR